MIVKKPCAICKNDGVRRPVEKLPGNGILWRVDHGNGVICEWGDYDSLDDIRNAKGDKPAVDIRCPECAMMGKIGSKVNDPVQKPDTYTYQIHHADDAKSSVIANVILAPPSKLPSFN